MAVDIFAGPLPIELYGKVVDLRYEMASFTDDDTGEEVEQEKIVVEIQDLVKDLDWNMTPRFTRASARKEGSKWNSFVSHMAEIGHPIKGQDDLVGHCFQFNVITLNPEKGKFASKNYPKPVRYFETEADCIAAAGDVEPVENGDGLTAAQEQLIEIANGKTFEQLLSAALGDDLLKGDGDLISALATTQKPLNDLVAAGELSLEGDKYHKHTA